MPDILRVTTPLPGQESANRARPDMPPEQQQIQTVTDPKRVTGTNPQDVYADREANKFLPNYESNYEMFLQLLSMSPDAMEEFRTLFFSKSGQIISSGIGEGMAEELAAFMELMQMDEAELLEFVKGQLDGSVKFTGPFFDILRQTLHNTNSPALQQSIIDFLKSYDSMASSQHILNELLANIESMVENLPQTMAAKLAELAEGLQHTVANGQNAASLAEMKEQIMPFLARYINTMHDYGPVRDFVTMFVLNLARYESGTMETFVQSVQNLLSFSEITDILPGVETDALVQALMARVHDNSELANQLVNLIAKGMSGQAGTQSKAVFENILRAMLVNESVYMPLLHAMIPADVDGKLFYSELWVDPDAEEGYQKETYERAVKLLIKFDIKDRGFFELVMLYSDSGVDIQLYTPEGMLPFRRQIRTAINEIATRNDLKIQNFAQEQALEPKRISEVFPKLYERKNAINVVV